MFLSEHFNRAKKAEVKKVKKPIHDIDSMTKQDIVEGLKAKGIDHSDRELKADLFAKLTGER